MNLKHFEAVVTLLNKEDKFGNVIMKDDKKVIKTFSGKIITHLLYNGEHLKADESIYLLGYHNCDGKCEIGKPLSHCLFGKKNPTPKDSNYRCAVVNATPVTDAFDFSLSMESISKLIDGCSPRPEKQYFLFGLDAVSHLNENDNNVQSLIDDEIDYELEEFDPTQSNCGTALLNAMELYEVNDSTGWAFITKDEHDLLNK